MSAFLKFFAFVKTINLNDQLSWPYQVISTWKSNKIKLQAGLSVAKMAEFEDILNFIFPDDFVNLYGQVNGFKDFDWNEHMFSFWSLERIVQEYKENDDVNYVGFCDFLISSHTIGFRRHDKKIVKNYDPMQPISETFQEVVRMINSSSDLIY